MFQSLPSPKKEGDMPFAKHIALFLFVKDQLAKD
jgi:hypothetical protein